MTKEEITRQLKKAQKLIEDSITALSVLEGGARSGKQSKEASVSLSVPLNFSANERNFIRTHAKGLSGPKKFTLLLAYTAKGKAGVDVEVGNLSARWNKLKAKNLMGYAFNVKYPSEAKTYGWVDSKKYGTYCLTDSWKEILS